MKTFGLLLVLGAIGGGIWFSIYPADDLAIVGVYAIAAAAGVFLLVRDRAAELFVKDVGDVKAVREHVAAEAREVGQLREQAQSSRAALDQLAQSAKDSHALAESVRERNKEAQDKLREVNETLAKAARALQTFETLVAATSEYYSEALLNMIGNPGMERELRPQTPVARLLEGTYAVHGSTFTFNADGASEARFREVVELFPKFPYGYSYLASALWKRGDPMWRGFALRAVAILEKTVIVPGHHPDHDTALRQTRLLLAQ